MHPLTLEGVDKAKGDFGTASREIRVRVQPNHDAVCFHAQQMAEKYLRTYPNIRASGVFCGAQRRKKHHPNIFRIETKGDFAGEWHSDSEDS